MRLIGPIRRPLWLAAAVGEGVLEVALNVVREVRSALEQVVVSEPRPPVPEAPRGRKSAGSDPGLFDRTSRGRVPARAPDVPARPVAPAPTPPPMPDEAKALDDEPVLVAEPWKGYDGMNVKAVNERLASADREVLGAVVLYEGVAKKRKSVTQAAERRLTQLSPPRSS